MSADTSEQNTVQNTSNPIRHDWRREEVGALFELPFSDLIFRAQTVHRAHFDPNQVQMSTLLSIKTGGCPEDCAYCPQSAHHEAGVAAQRLMQVEAVLAEARRAKQPSDLSLLPRRNEHHAPSGASGATRPTTSVHVAIRVSWRIHVNHEFDVGDVNAARRDVSRNERLDLEKHGPRALERAHHDRARSTPRSFRKEQARRILDGDETAGSHLEDAELTRGTISILRRAHDAVSVVLGAFKIEHGVHHVLERFWPRQVAFFIHVACKKNGRPGGFRKI